MILNAERPAERMSGATDSDRGITTPPPAEKAPVDSTAGHQDTSWDLMGLLPSYIDGMNHLSKCRPKWVEHFYWRKARDVLRPLSSWVDAMVRVIEEDELPVAKEREELEAEIAHEKADKAARTVKW